MCIRDRAINSLSGSLFPHMSVSYFTVTGMGFLRAVNSLNGSLFPHMLVSYFTVTGMGFLRAVNTLNGSLFPHTLVSYFSFFTVTGMGFWTTLIVPFPQDPVNCILQIMYSDNQIFEL